jgi:uncharacterized membrane protein YjgN (DUF898 family)
MADQKLQFQFNASGKPFFVLLLKNVFFTVITLGIYSFWAGVNIKKYLYSQTSFFEGEFGYHATGKERFIAFLKGLLFILAIIIASAVLQFLLQFIVGLQAAAIIVVILFFCGFILLLPVLKVGSLRFHLSKTSWKEYRFRFTGQASELFMILLKGIPLTIITLGIYGAWFLCDLSKYVYNNIKIGNYNFNYDANGKELFFKYLKGFLLTAITLGIYGSWFVADLERFNWEHTSFQGKRFKSDVTGGNIFVLMLTNILLITFTLGIGFAWAFVRTQKYFLENTSITETPDTAELTNIVDEKANAATEGIENAVSFLDSLVDIF